MSVKWDTIAGQLELDDRQAILARYLIDRGKDDCLDLWEVEAEDHRPRPIAFAVRMKIGNPGLDPHIIGGRLIEYLASTKAAGTASSYLQVQYEREVRMRAELVDLLRPEQASKLAQFGIGSLVFDIDTGYAPADDRIAWLVDRAGGPNGQAVDEALLDARQVSDGDRRPHPSELRPAIVDVTANAGVDWARARAEAALDDRQATVVAYRLNKLQDRCADLWATMASGFGASPFEFLVDLRLRDAALPFDALAGPLTAYLAERRPIDADQTFLERQADLERSAYRDLARVLDAGQVERLRSVAAGSLLNIATGHTSMARRLSELYDENRLKHGIDLFCQMPFEYAHIEDTGEVLPCCPSKFRLSIGNLNRNTMHEVWSSEAARAVRDSIHDKTFRFCNYYACEYLKKGRAIHGDN